MSLELIQADKKVEIIYDGAKAGELFYSIRTGKIILEPDKVLREADNVIKVVFKDARPAFEIRVPCTEEPYTYTEKGIVIGGLTGKTGRFFNIKKAPFEYARTYYIASGKCAHVSGIYISLTARALDEFGTGDERLLKANWSEVASNKFKHMKFLLIDNQKVTAVQQGERQRPIPVVS